MRCFRIPGNKLPGYFRSSRWDEGGELGRRPHLILREWILQLGLEPGGTVGDEAVDAESEEATSGGGFVDGPDVDAEAGGVKLRDGEVEIGDVVDVDAGEVGGPGLVDGRVE